MHYSPLMERVSTKLVTDLDGQKKLVSFNHNKGKVVVQTVREEEEYMKHLEKIIQRDYFPDLSATGNQTPDIASASTDTERAGVWSDSDSRNPEKKDPCSLSLDKYMANNTTEDNASFAELIEEAEKKRRLTLSNFFPSFKAVSQSALEGSKPMAIAGGSQVNVGPRLALSGNNPVHFNPDGVSQTHDELVEHLANDRRIVPANTRFKRPFLPGLDKLRLAKHSTRGKLGHVSVDGKESITPMSTPQAAGYRFMDASPSPAPSAFGASPLMTWGELEATPSRLDDATPMVVSGIPAFHISSPSKREQLAHRLADKAGRQRVRDRNEAVKRAHSGLTSPCARSLLSPAARRLLANSSSILSSRPDTGSLTPLSKSRTPRRLQQLGVIRRPTTGTEPPASPMPGKTGVVVSSTVHTEAAADKSITDNLLNLKPAHA